MFPDTAEQRCWFHKIGNVLAALPKSAHPGAKEALAQIWNAEDRRHAQDAEHWQHLRTTNPIESTFATVRHRTNVTKGPSTRAAGATFTAGKLVERPTETAA